MKDGIHIRVAIPGDAEEMVAVQGKTWISTYPSLENGITQADIEEKVQEMADGAVERRRKRIEEDSSSLLYLVAVLDEQVIGFIMGVKTDDKNRVGALYVLPEYQKQGIGSKLLDSVLLWFNSNKAIVLEVASYNYTAIYFYKKFGFRENGPTTNGVAKLPSGKVIPEIEMIRRSY